MVPTVLLFAPRRAPALLAKSSVVGPEVGQRIEFLSDELTDKGPATGEIIDAKITVDGLYVTVKFADGQQTFSWDDLDAAGADVRGDLWMVKSHPALFPGPASMAQAEAGNYLKRRISWRGCTLVVENEAGTVRKGHGWETRMLVPYGEVEGTVGLDGDRIDVYVGPDLEAAPFVYIVHQRRYGQWDEHDEDKVMLGFMSEEDAAVMYLKHYDDPRFLGPITVMSADEFAARCRGEVAMPTPLVKSWFGDADLLKATLKKTITVPGYTKADGTVVPPHQKSVHFNPNHVPHEIAGGGVSHSQKQAHAKLSKEDWFDKLDTHEKALHVMSHATDIQDAASASAAVSGWKAAALAGKNPSAAQWAAFNALPKIKQAPLWDVVKEKVGNWNHLKQPVADAAPEAAEPPALDWAKESEAQTALNQLAQGKGSYYQNEAYKKLSADASWKGLIASEAHAQVMDLYKQLQGAASQAAAVSLWKKALLAGKVPSPGQHAAFIALSNQDSAKAEALVGSVVTAIGSAAMFKLTGQANAKLQDAGSAVTAAAPAPTPAPAAAAPAAPAAADPPALAVAKTFGLVGGTSTQSLMNLAASGDLTGLKKVISSLGAAKKKTKAFGQALASKVYAMSSVPIGKQGAIDAWHTALMTGKDPTPDQWEVFNSLDESTKDNLSESVVGHAAGEHVAHAMKALETVQAAEPAAPSWKSKGGEKSQILLPNGETLTVHLAPSKKHLSVTQHSAAGKVLYNDGGHGAGTAHSLMVHLAGKQGLPQDTMLTLEGMLAAAKPAATPAPTPAPQKTFTAPKTVLHNTTDGHYKQWSVYVAGSKVITEYGKIGGTQQSTTKEFPSLQAAHAHAEKLKGEKMAKGYFHHFTDYSHKAASDGAAADPGPKDGDTKPGADGGTLVFKDGHWHKQDGPKTSAAHAISPADQTKLLASIPGVTVLSGKGKKYLAAAQVAVGKGDVSALMGIIESAENSSFNMPKTLAAMKYLHAAMVSKGGDWPHPATPFAGVDESVASPLPGNKTYMPMKDHGPVAAPAAAPASVAPAVPLSSGFKPPKAGDPVPMTGWKKVGEQKGSNPGGSFQDKLGTTWYCKFPADEDAARSEVLAAKFYQMLGANVPMLKLVRREDGKVGVASKWVDGLKKVDAAKLASAPGAHEGFVFDAWLGNWDVVGASNDNLLLDSAGKALRADVGGSLGYRAQGAKKKDAEFSGSVIEFESMVDGGKNPKAAAVFSSISKAKLIAGAGILNRLKPSQITELVEKLGPGKQADKEKLAATLIARRADILKKLGVSDQWDAQKKLDPTKLPVNPKDLPKPIDFENFAGPGKGLSAKAWLNKQNSADSAALVAFAAKGNLTTLKDYKYEAVDKETGKSLGMKPITEHPSNKVQEQWTQLVELLQSIASPSVPTLEMPSMGGVGAIEDISAFVGAFSPHERPETVATEHRLGFFMALNQIDDVHDLVKGMKWSFITKGGSWAQKMKAGYSSLSAKVRDYIKAVQASGTINHVWSQGKATSQGISVHALSAKIYEEAAELPEGTVLRRGMSDTTAGKQMTKLLLQAKPGLVIQNTDSMCTSFNEDHSWGGDVQMTIRCPKGCKATPSFASGAYTGEYEITTLPGQRFVVLAVEKAGTGVKLDVLMLPPHEGYVAQLKKLGGLTKALQSAFMFFQKVL